MILKSEDDGYSLTDFARKYSQPENDAFLAFAREVATLHHDLILRTPEKLKQGTLWRPEDQDGDLIARSSRSLEPFQTEAIDRTFPASGTCVCWRSAAAPRFKSLTRREGILA